MRLPNKLSLRYAGAAAATGGQITDTRPQQRRAHSTADLTEKINLAFKGEELENEQSIDEELAASIARRIKFRLPSTQKESRARAFTPLIGPTGVGKMTALAKLATSYRYWGGIGYGDCFGGHLPGGRA